MKTLIAIESAIGENGLLVYKDEIVTQYGNEIKGLIYVETDDKKNADIFQPKYFKSN